MEFKMFPPKARKTAALSAGRDPGWCGAASRHLQKLELLSELGLFRVRDALFVTHTGTSEMRPQVETRAFAQLACDATS